MKFKIYFLFLVLLLIEISLAKKQIKQENSENKVNNETKILLVSGNNANNLIKNDDIQFEGSFQLENNMFYEGKAYLNKNDFSLSNGEKLMSLNEKKNNNCQIFLENFVIPENLIKKNSIE